MTHLLNGFYWLICRGPLALGAVAVAILGLGFYLQIGENERTAARAQMLADGPPDLVTLTEFAQQDRRSYRSGPNEVVIQAQLLWDYSFDFWYEEEFGTDYVVMFPLVEPGSRTTDNVLGVAILQAEDESFETFSADIAQASFVKDGVLGPVMNLNGSIDGLGKWQGLTEEAFYDDGFQMPDDPVVIWPFVKGREDALAPPAPGEMTIFGLMSKIAGAFALLALGKLVIGRKPDPQDTQLPADSATVTSPATVPATSTVPLWKQRSGLVDDSIVQDPAVFEPVQFDAQPEDPAPAIRKPARRSGFGLRKVLICIVGALFVLGLAATLSDLVGKSAPAQTVDIQTPQERLADSAADIVVPDADPNRHWTDIDVTPMVEWVVAKFFLALSGDVDAQITLGMMVGGLLVALFMVRWFFVMRRALRPKSTTRFSDMGIN